MQDELEGKNQELQRVWHKKYEMMSRTRMYKGRYGCETGTEAGYLRAMMEETAVALKQQQEMVRAMKEEMTVEMQDISNRI